MRHRATKFCMWLYLVGLYQDCPNYSLGVQIGRNPGIRKFYMDLYRENLRNLPAHSHTA